MSAVWIILAVVAVVGVIAVVARLRRRGPGRAPETPSAETTAGDAAQEAVARGKGAAERAVGSSGGAARELATAATAPPEPVAPTRAEPVEEELKSRVEALLEDSERMLGELRRAAADSGRKASPAIAGSVEVLEEGLQEIRALAQRKQWSQAREKGEALRAQLSLMLPTSPGKKAS